MHLKQQVLQAIRTGPFIGVGKILTGFFIRLVFSRSQCDALMELATDIAVVGDCFSQLAKALGRDFVRSQITALRNLLIESRDDGFGLQVDGTVVFALPFSRRATALVGDFNGWNPSATPFAESLDQRRLEATVALPPGTHAYRIVVDGNEMLDEFNNLRDETIGANVVVVPGVRDESAQGHALSTHAVPAHASEGRIQ